jgi:LysM repeat protein
MPRLTTAAAIVSVISKSNDFAKASDVETAEASDYMQHTVQSKETIYSISKKYAVMPQDVVKWNHLQNMNLRVGQQLRIKKS